MKLINVNLKNASTRVSRNFSSEPNKKIKVAYLEDKFIKELKNGVTNKKISSFLNKESPFIPRYLDLTAQKIIQHHKRKTFHADVSYMKNMIKNYTLPLEEMEIQYLIKELEHKETAKGKENILEHKELSEQKKYEIINNKYKRIYSTLKRKIESWKEINYDEYTSIVYMAARLTANYISLKKVFNEIKVLDPLFKPQTLFDFGSGIGTTMHVANEVWPGSIFEHLNVDLNKDMNNLSDLLLKNASLDNESIFNNVFYRQYLSVKNNLKYDLVVSAFSLKELPNVNSRINTIENLWQKTKDILVIVEHGNKAGTSAILEARSFLLKLNGYDSLEYYDEKIINKNRQLKTISNNPNFHIMAPCSHHYCCPHLKHNNPKICNFQINHFPINYNQNNYLLEKENFSYIVFRKKSKEETDFVHLPRIVSKPIKSTKCFNLKICNINGKLENVTVSKRKCDKDTYDCVKGCKWGDIFPIKIQEISKELFEKNRKKQNENN